MSGRASEDESGGCVIVMDGVVGLICLFWKGVPVP